MYINNEDFVKWATLISQNQKETNSKLNSLINTNDVFDKDDKPLDNQDVSLMLNVSHRTLQRYRDNDLLPFFKIGQKVYYKTSDVRNLTASKNERRAAMEIVVIEKKTFEQMMQAAAEKMMILKSL